MSTSLSPDRPSAPAPGEVAWETTEREMEAAQAKNHEAGDDQQETEEEKRATEVRHIDQGGEKRSGSGKEGCGFAEKLCRLAGFGEDAYGAGELEGVIAHVFEVGVKPGEHDDAAGRLFFRDVR